MTGRALLASPLGFLVGMAVGALGGGGSILAVPVLVFVVGLSASEAASTSLVVVGTASALGAYRHWRAGRVRVGPGAAFGAVGIAGSVAGSALNRRIDDDLLLLGFAALVLVAAWRIVTGCPSCTRTGEAEALAGDPPAGGGAALATKLASARATRASRAARVAGAGTAVGFLTGLFGVGGGFVVVPALALVLAFPMPAAIGTSLLVVTINAATALAARVVAGGGTVAWGPTLLFAAAAMAGVAAGTRVAGRVDASSLQRAFAWLLVAVALYTGARAVLAIW